MDKELIDIPIGELSPYAGNAKIHTEEQVRKIADSISKLGMNSPIIVNGQRTILAGHGRYEACKLLGMEKVPCVVLTGLTEQQEKAFILNDNKLNMETGFDMEALNAELQAISDFDMGDFGFEVPDFDFEPERDRTRDDERLRTDRAYNLDIVNIEDCDGYWEFPVLGIDEVVPDDLIGFNYVMNSDVSGYGVHFYLDDYQFERIWNDPDKYVPYLEKAQCVIMPDFSLYLDMPFPMKLWNMYRSRTMAHYWQRLGLKVIPSLSWGEPKTFDFCFKGIPRGSIVSVSTLGVKNSEETMKIWSDGMDEAIRQIRPSMVLLYGGDFGYDFGDIPVREYDNHVTKRMKKAGEADGR